MIGLGLGEVFLFLKEREEMPKALVRLVLERHRVGTKELHMRTEEEGGKQGGSARVGFSSSSLSGSA
jgi:hypothetical protein